MVRVAGRIAPPTRGALLAVLLMPALAGAQPSDGRAEALRQKMTGAVLVGWFSQDGNNADSSPLKEERYEIRRVTRLGNGDFWLFESRIVYGEIDVTVPVPLQVKWAGELPVITLDRVTIPGLGTFSAYVLIDGQRYAGTWSHDEVGGHLFGRIETANDARGPKVKGGQADAAGRTESR
jgi:hypothetical protein